MRADSVSMPLGWGLAGAAAGLAAGSIVWAVGADGLVPGGLAGGLLGALTGGLIDRKVKAPRPSWVIWVPTLAAVPALFWLGVLLAVLQDRLTPLLGLGGFGIAVLVAAMRAHARGQVARAIADLEEGDERARRRLTRIELRGRGGARAARYALAMADLREGQLESAAARLAAIAVSDGPTGGPATAALGLVRLLQGRTDAAMHAVADALVSGGPGVQAQTDAVRVLYIWRTESVGSARALAESVVNPRSPALLLALLSVLRRQTGDPAGGEALLTPAVRARVARARWGERVPELYSFCE